MIPGGKLRNAFLEPVAEVEIPGMARELRLEFAGASLRVEPGAPLGQLLHLNPVRADTAGAAQ